MLTLVVRGLPLNRIPIATVNLSLGHDYYPLPIGACRGASSPRTTPHHARLTGRANHYSDRLPQILKTVKGGPATRPHALLMRKKPPKAAFYLSICKTDTNRSIL